MAKLAPIRVYAHHEHKIVFEHKFPCKVLADGLFRITIADELREEFKAFLGTVKDAPSMESRSQNEVAFKEHAKAARLCHDFGIWKVSAVETRELIILYEQSSVGRYFVTGNGLVQPTPEENGEWFRLGSRSFGRNGATVGVSADIAVRVKITARGGAVTYKWDRPTDEELGPHGKELRAYELHMRPSLYAEKEPPSIPYTEKAAAFFVKEIQATLQRARALHLFMAGDADALAERIEKGLAVCCRPTLTTFPRPRVLLSAARPTSPGPGSPPARHTKLCRETC